MQPGTTLLTISALILPTLEKRKRQTGLTFWWEDNNQRKNTSLGMCVMTGMEYSKTGEGSVLLAEVSGKASE